MKSALSVFAVCTIARYAVQRCCRRCCGCIVATTGDEAILSEPVPFLSGEPLRPDEVERYARFTPTERRATLYEHCVAAIERGRTAGPHGLPLFGAGDGNDGMNRVGIQGRGESVWLGWFL
jgi:cyclic beta-1,2-glucan synthetase